MVVRLVIRGRNIYLQCSDKCHNGSWWSDGWSHVTRVVIEGCRSGSQCLLDWWLEVDKAFINSVHTGVIMVVDGQMGVHMWIEWWLKVVIMVVGCCSGSGSRCLLDWWLKVDKAFIGSIQTGVMMVVGGQMGSGWSGGLSDDREWMMWWLAVFWSGDWSDDRGWMIWWLTLV
jgi:hypothetical protein